MKEIGDRIRWARVARRMTQAELAEALQVARVSVTQWEGNTTRPDISKYKLIADVLGGNAEWYITGKGDPPISEALLELERAKNDGVFKVERKHAVPQFNIHAGMGNGGTLSVLTDNNGLAIDPSDSDGFWTFPASVRSGFRGLRNVYAMPVTGDSMEPTLPNGAYVFIDTSHTMPSPPDIYAVDYGDGLMVKRIELVPKSEMCRVISDNDFYRSYELNRQDVNVLGII